MTTDPKHYTLEEIKELLANATPGPWEECVIDRNLDPVEAYREHLSHGSGDIWAVYCPRHPRTIRPVGPGSRPKHAVFAANTGNGPTSPANAKFIAAAPTIIAQLIEQVEENERHLGQLGDDLVQAWDEREKLREQVETLQRLHSEAEAQITCRNEMRAELEKLRAENERLTHEVTWVRRKLKVSDDAPVGDVQGRLHNWEHGYNSYQYWVEATGCKDKDVEIGRLKERNTHFLELLQEFYEWADGYQNPKTGMGSGLHAEKWPSLSPSARKLMLQIVNRADCKLAQALQGERPSILVDRVMLEECLARLEGLVSAYSAEQEALRDYFDECGFNHSDEDCPQDDTCDCPELIPLSDAWNTFARQIELAHRRIDKLKQALQGGDLVSPVEHAAANAWAAANSADPNEDDLAWAKQVANEIDTSPDRPSTREGSNVPKATVDGYGDVTSGETTSGERNTPINETVGNQSGIRDQCICRKAVVDENGVCGYCGALVRAYAAKER